METCVRVCGRIRAPGPRTRQLLSRPPPSGGSGRSAQPGSDVVEASLGSSRRTSNVSKWSSRTRRRKGRKKKKKRKEHAELFHLSFWKRDLLLTVMSHRSVHVVVAEVSCLLSSVWFIQKQKKTSLCRNVSFLEVSLCESRKCSRLDTFAFPRKHDFCSRRTCVFMLFSPCSLIKFTYSRCLTVKVAKNRRLVL